MFCGTSSGTKPEFVETVKKLGRIIAERNMHLFYGGGNLGLMGYVSNTMQECDSQVLGIIENIWQTKTSSENQMENNILSQVCLKELLK